MLHICIYMYSSGFKLMMRCILRVANVLVVDANLSGPWRLSRRFKSRAPVSRSTLCTNERP